MSLDNEVFDFEKMPFPILKCDKNGKVIYKNAFAAKMKLVRINTRFSKLVCENEQERLFDTLKNNASGIFTCIKDLGISYAITLGLSDGTCTVFIIVNSVIIKQVMQSSFIDSEYQAYKTNEYIISVYESMCRKLSVSCKADTAELLKCNALRFSKVARYFSIYCDILTKNSVKEISKTYDILQLCGSLCKYFGNKLSPLGFRLNFKLSDDLLCIKVPKTAFICVFLELASVALRSSRNKTADIRVFSLDIGKITFEYEFEDISIAASETLFEVELEFASALSSALGWSFSGFSAGCDGKSTLSLTLPGASITDLSYVRTPDFLFDFERDEIYDIADEVFSDIYFTV